MNAALFYGSIGVRGKKKKKPSYIPVDSIREKTAYRAVHTIRNGAARRNISDSVVPFSKVIIQSNTTATWWKSTAQLQNISSLCQCYTKNIKYYS